MHSIPRESREIETASRFLHGFLVSAPAISAEEALGKAFSVPNGSLSVALQDPHTCAPNQVIALAAAADGCLKGERPGRDFDPKSFFFI